MIPLVAGLGAGAALNLIGTIGAAIDKEGFTKEQMARSNQLRMEAKNVKTPDLTQGFKDALDLSQVQYLKGLPGFDEYINKIGLNTGAQIDAAKDAAGTSGQLLSFISAANSQGTNAMTDLFVKDAQARADNANNMQKTFWQVGEEQKINEAIARQERDALNQQANALETAATANDMQARNELIKGTTGGLAGMIGAFTGDPAGQTGTYKSMQTVGSNIGTAGQQITPQFIQQTIPNLGPALGNLGVKTTVGDNGAIDFNPATASKEQILDMQKRLSAAGYPVTLDGIFGPNTHKALYDYTQSLQSEFAPYNLMSLYNTMYVKP